MTSRENIDYGNFLEIVNTFVKGYTTLILLDNQIFALTRLLGITGTFQVNFLSVYISRWDIRILEPEKRFRNNEG